jgi:Mn-dependent DtxR family transcriptional regulator
VAELEALLELGTAEPAKVTEAIPARLAAEPQRVAADLARMEAKGLVRRVTGYTLTEEGRELLTAILKIKGHFPGRGRPGVHANGNGKAAEE